MCQSRSRGQSFPPSYENAGKIVIISDDGWNALSIKTLKCKAIFADDKI
jgi:hypothetical protein